MKSVWILLIALTSVHVLAAEPFERAALRTRFFATAFNSYSKNQSLLLRIRENLSKADRVEFEEVLKNKRTFQNVQVIQVGDQVQFFSKSKDFIISIAFDGTEENTLIIDGWIKQRYDPKNIWESVQKTNSQFSFWFNHFLPKAYSTTKQSFSPETAIFLVAAAKGLDLKKIPDVDVTNMADINNNGLSNFFFSDRKSIRRGQGGYLEVPSKVTNPNLKVTCNSQSRARIEVKEDQSGEVYSLNDSGDYIEYSSPLHKKAVKIGFESLNPDLDFYRNATKKCILENLKKECPEGQSSPGPDFFYCQFINSNLDKTKPYIDAPNPIETKASIIVANFFSGSAPSVSALLVRLYERLDHPNTPTINSRNDQFSARLHETGLKCIPRGRILQAKILTSEGSSNKANLEEVEQALKTIAKDAKMIQAESEVAGVLKDISDFETGFQQQHGFKTPLRVDDKGALVGPPPAKPDGAELSNYKTKYVELLKKLNLAKRPLQNSGKYSRIESGVSLIRAFGRCCGSSDCRATMAEKGLNIKNDPKYNIEDKKPGATK